MRALGRVFVANMTGNVVFLGFAAVGAGDFSVLASLAAILAFLLGAIAGGRFTGWLGAHRGKLLATTISMECLLVGLSLCIAIGNIVPAPFEQYFLIAALAIAMGMQNAVARRLAVPDLTTTVPTLTLTGFAAESALAGSKSPRPGRRVIVTVAIFAGAALGALLLLNVGTGAVLAVVLVLLLTALAMATPYWWSTEAWTQG